jgi:hypothetical protein
VTGRRQAVSGDEQIVFEPTRLVMNRRRTAFQHTHVVMNRRQIAFKHAHVVMHHFRIVIDCRRIVFAPAYPPSQLKGRFFRWCNATRRRCGLIVHYRKWSA